jgi:hypothetical protein
VDYRRKRRRKHVALFAVPVSALIAFLALGQIVAAKSGAGASHACGGHERWQIKTLTDDDVSMVRFNRIVDTTVDRLRALRSRPEMVSSRSGRIRPVERTVYRVRATLHEAKLEPDDDIHLVVQDDDLEDTLIVEFPDTRCEAAGGSLKAAEMAAARADFLAHVSLCLGRRPSLRSFTPLGGKVTIIGVGFWDVKHGTAQRGRAPQDFELHPVLGFTRGVCP